MSASVTGSTEPGQACAAAPMALTGERTVPGLAEENYWFRRHEVVYRRLVDR
ncbi:MAG TPA: SAM-dependent methyltransferase, partial [Mycobacterium sp.]